MRLKTIFILALWLSLSPCLQADPVRYKIDHYMVNEQLQAANIRAMVQDKLGYLWVASNDGLFRFDGFHFSSPLSLKSLTKPSFCCLYQDNQGEVWVGSQADGLFRLDTREDQLKPCAQIRAKTIYDMVGTRQGYQWILTENGLFGRDEKNRDQKIALPRGVLFQTGQNHYLTLDSGDNLWLAMGRSLYRLDEKTRRLRPVFVDFAQSNLLTLEALDKNWLLVGTERNGLYLVDTRLKRIINLARPKTFSNFNEANYITSIKKDSKGIVWAGSSYGLHPLDVARIFSNPSDSQLLPDASLLIDIQIKAFFEDRTGVYWLSVQDGGLLKVSTCRPVFSHYPPNERDAYSLKDAKVNTFLEDKKGLVWIGSRKGLTCFQPTTGQFVPYPLEKREWDQKNEVSTLNMSSGGDLLVGTWNRNMAFSIYSPTTRKFNHFNFGNDWSNTVGSVLESKGQFFVATFGHGMLRLNPSDLTQSTLVEKPCFQNKQLDKPYFLFKDSKEQIWVSFYKNGLGLYDVKKGRMQHFVYREGVQSLSSNMVHSICEDASHRIWIATDNGLNLYQPSRKTFVSYYPENWSRNNKILGLACDAFGNIWFSQTDRIGTFYPSTKTFLFYDVLSWLPNCSFQSVAAYADRRGRIYFGTKNYGFLTIEPRQKDVVQRPSVAISQLKINNQEVLPEKEINGRILLHQSIHATKELKLRYSDKIIEFDFTGLSFMESQDNKFAYRLHGWQDEWIYTNNFNRSAVYLNLAPGNYIFQVKAANHLGLWSPVKSLVLVVKCPPWKTGWAYLLYVLLLTAIVSVLIRYQLKRRQILEDLKYERFEKEQVKQLNHQRMQFFTNISHEFRTPLTLISAYNSQMFRYVKPMDAIYPWVINTKKNTEQLLLLVNQLLDFRKLEEQQMRLSVTSCDVVAFCSDLFHLFTDLSAAKDIQYRFHSTEKSAMVWFDRQMLERILFNLLSNAFKFTHEGETVDLCLSFENLGEPTCKLILEVQDTGKGISANELERIFENFYQVKSNPETQQQGTGIGLAFVRQLVELHRGTIRVDSEKGKGSVFCVELPVGEPGYETYESDKRSSGNVFPETVLKAEPSIAGVDKSLGSRPLILVVEDNPELRTFISQTLLNDYRSLEASQGQEGYQMAVTYHPDLIISDVLMPVEDGLRFCRRIKDDIQTSHIPFILLTAQVLDSTRKEGFQSGADDFIEKPFSPELFLLKIQNMLDTRSSYKDHFLRNAEEVMPVSPLDEQFFQQAIGIIDLHLSDCEFDVDAFCTELKLGQKLVYRKIKAVTGLSITEYIRSERLKRAAHLLRENRYTVQEISFKVGFATPSYFSKCFKKQFGVLPKDF